MTDIAERARKASGQDISTILWESSAEIRKLRDNLNDCVALLLGHVGGGAQRDGIIRESIKSLGDHYSGPSAALNIQQRAEK